MKDYRKEELKTYVLGNILMILFLSGALKPFLFFGTLNADSFNNYKEIMVTLMGSALLSSIFYSYIYIFDSVVPSKWKDYIVYSLMDRPGDDIFDEIKTKNVDSRFTTKDAIKKYQDIYNEMDTITDKEKRRNYQNSKWYGIYQSIEKNDTVALSQKDFLCNRDMCSITIVIIIVYVLIAIISGVYCIQKSIIYWMIGEFFITNFAARGKAKRFAYNVIAKDIHKKN